MQFNNVRRSLFLKFKISSQSIRLLIYYTHILILSIVFEEKILLFLVQNYTSKLTFYILKESSEIFFSSEFSLSLLAVFSTLSSIIPNTTLELFLEEFTKS